MTTQEAQQLKPGDSVRATHDRDDTAVVVDRFGKQLILLWKDGEIRHHTHLSLPHLERTP